MIKIIKLVNGETILTDISVKKDHHNDATDDYILDNPVKMVMDPQGNMHFTNWILACKDKSITLNKRHILCQCDADDNIATFYAKQFSTIIVPDIVV